jgi:drug/metabolite transporter (DMT)-like permease
MNAVVSALIGFTLSAVSNTVLDVKLKQYSTAELLIGWYLILLPFGAVLFMYQKYWGTGARIPQGSDFTLMAVAAVFFFLADFFYLNAYTKYGGDVVTITILVTLIPVIAAVLKFGWVGEAPTKYHVVAFAFAALAVTFIAIGNKQKPVERATASATQVQAQ